MTRRPERRPDALTRSAGARHSAAQHGAAQPIGGHPGPSAETAIEVPFGDPDHDHRPRVRPGVARRRPARSGRQALRRRRRGRRRRSRRARRRVLLDARSVGLGQDDDAADDRRLRDADERPRPAPRRGRHEDAAVRPRREHGLPGLRPVPAHDRRRQRRLRPDGPQGPEARARHARHRGAAHGPPARVRGAQAEPAVGRPAPAGRARPRAGQPAARPAPRRAARRARPQAPRGDADRAEGHPAAGRHHVHLRDPRPGRGAHDERPPGRLQQGPDRADRRAGRRLRAPDDPLRRRLRRHLQPADRARSRRPSSGGAGTFTIRPEKIRMAEPRPRPARTRTRRSGASGTSSTSARTPVSSSRSTPARTSSSPGRTSRRRRPRHSHSRARLSASSGSDSTICPSRTGSEPVRNGGGERDEDTKDAGAARGSGHRRVGLFGWWRIHRPECRGDAAASQPAASEAGSTAPSAAAATPGTEPAHGRRPRRTQGQTINVLAWPGYVENGSTDPTVRLGHGLREGDRLQGQAAVVRDLGRGLHAVLDQPGAVRRRLGVG